MHDRVYLFSIDPTLTKFDAIDLFFDAVDCSYAKTVFITDSDGMPEGTNAEGLTADEARKADGEYMRRLFDELGYEGEAPTIWAAYAKDQGADSLAGGWLVYLYGSAAGDERSYAINVRTGEKIVAGPNSFFYGTSMDDDGASPFWGSGNIYPGDKYPEAEQNLRLSIGWDVD